MKSNTLRSEARARLPFASWSTGLHHCGQVLYWIVATKPILGLVAAIAAAPQLLEVSPDGVSYLAIALASAVLLAVSLRIQVAGGPGVVAWCWMLGAAAFAKTPLMLAGWDAWWLPPWEILFVLLLLPLGKELRSAWRSGAEMRSAAAVVAAPLVLGYGLGVVPMPPGLYWQVAQIPLWTSVLIAAVLSLRLTGGTSCRN